MIIPTNIDLSEFLITEKEIAGEPCRLIQPNHIGTKWTKHNLIFRSSIWNSKNELISASYKKFFNWGEQPDLDYTPFSMTANGGVSLLDKIDGSTLCLGKYRGELIHRTRGTFDAASTMQNGHEIELFKSMYPKVFNNLWINDNQYSLIFEWVSPENIIVLKYDEPDIILTNVIRHSDYSYLTQKEVDAVAKELGVKRPRRYNFDKLKEMIEAVEVMKGVEGICCYCNKDQSIRKVKSAEYLAKHRFKESATIENTLDLYFEYAQPSYSGFEAKLIETFDYECFEMVRGFASRICEAQKEVDLILKTMKMTAENLRKVSRKDAAAEILQKWGETNRSGFVFKFLDGKSLSSEDMKKLFWQVLKK